MANWGFADPASALSVGTVLTAGIYFRDLTGGVGQELTSMMLRSNMYVNAEEMMICNGTATEIERVDPDYFGLGPTYRLYGAGARTWVFLGCKTESEWHRFCQAVGDEELASERFATASGRSRYAAELVVLLERVFSTKDADEWDRSLTQHGVPCVRADGPPNAVFATRDQHMFDNGYAVWVEDSTGRYIRHGAIVHVDGPPDWLKGSSPHAECTKKILAEDVGLSSQEIDDLINKGMVKAR